MRFSVPSPDITDYPDFVIDLLFDADAGMFRVRWLCYSETEDT